MYLAKHYLEEVNKELDLARIRKQTLDKLLDISKISQPVYEYINKDLTEAITEIEGRRKTLADKMTYRANELENQNRLLETFLANLEICYATGEIDTEPYTSQGNAVSLGIDATKQELDGIKDALAKLIPEMVTSEASELVHEEVVSPSETITEELIEVETREEQRDSLY